MQSNRFPIPVVDKQSAVYSALQAQRAQLEHFLLPGQPKDIAGILYRLNAHYPQVKMNESLMDVRAQEYLEIMGQYPLKVVHEVCREVILDAEIKFYPTVADLNERARAKTFTAKWKLERVAKLLERAQ